MKPTYSLDAPDQQKLKIAKLEIEAVLRRHDIAGACVLHTPGMSEFFYDIRPSYSCAWVENDREFRIRSKRADYATVTLQTHDQAATANMLHALGTDLGQAAIMFLDMAHVADRTFGAEHTTATMVPDPAERRRQ